MPEYFSDSRFGGGEQVTVPGLTQLESTLERYAITALEGGGFVVVYEPSPTHFAMRAQIFGSDGQAIGEPITLTGDALPDVASLPGGGFVVVSMESVATNLDRINVQIFGADGQVVAESFSIGDPETDLNRPSVALLDSGNFVVVWEHNTFPSGTPGSIRAQVFDPSGTAVTSELLINQGTLNSVFPEVAALPGGAFVVAWDTAAQFFRDSEARAFDSSGNPLGPLVVPPGPDESHSNQQITVAGLPNGNYVLAWTEFTASDTVPNDQDVRVFAAVYSPQGALVSGPIEVSSDSSVDNKEADIAVREDGSFLITWEADIPNDNGVIALGRAGEIHARLFDANLAPLGESFTVNSVTDRGQVVPAVTAFGSDDFAFIWRNYYSDFSPNTDLQMRVLFSVTSGDDGSDLMVGTDGVDFLRAQGGVDVLNGGLGSDSLDGGSNVDTAVVSGLRADYTVTQTATGVFQVVGADGTDTLTAIEFLQLDDQTIRLLRGDGVTVNFETADPNVYQFAMNAIRDFDGNALGGNGSWLRIGSADINGDGDVDQILVNDAIGRFATVGTQGGLVYFEDYSWAGETRVAGIYIDPLVESGDVVAGSDNDSQRRFQNDLQIENINRVLGSDDYDGDGVWEVYFALTDGTAYLRALMHEDGNIRYANYQSEQEVIDYLTANGYDESTFGDWFGAATSTADTMVFVHEAPKFAEIETFERPVEFHARPVDEWQVEYFG